METKRCSKCGAIFNEPKTRFCENCGVVLIDSSEYTEKSKAPNISKKTFSKICALTIPILLITVVIFIYCHHRSKIKQRQFEAYLMLHRVHSFEYVFFLENRRYSTDPEEISFILFPEPEYYKFKIIFADDEGFIARAWGNIDDDDKIDIWEVTEKSREPVNIYNDVKNVGEEIDPLKP